jgi:hypothetical protein
MPVDPWVLRGAHLFFASVIVFIAFHGFKRGKFHQGMVFKFSLTFGEHIGWLLHFHGVLQALLPRWH